MRHCRGIARTCARIRSARSCQFLSEIRAGMERRRGENAYGSSFPLTCSRWRMRKSTSARSPHAINRLQEEYKQRMSRARLLSVAGFIVSIGCATSIWADIRRQQLKGWTLRVMDTFVLLDHLANKVSLLELVESKDASNSSWTRIVGIEKRIRRDLGADATVSTTATLPVESIRKADIFRAIEKGGVDVCAIFDEEDYGKIPLGRLIYGVTTMHILSQDQNTPSILSESQSHELMWMMLVNAAGVDVNSLESKSKKTASPAKFVFAVPAATVRLWIDAMACLGIIRGFEYLDRGAIAAAEPCASRVFQNWLSDAKISKDGLVSREDFNRLLSKVEYSMFWNRNRQRFKAIEFYRKQDRQVEYLRTIEEREEGVRNGGRERA